MKIGVLTFHNNYNYGAVLQCFATQQYLSSLGHDVEVINFCSALKPSIAERISARLRTISSFKELLHYLTDAYMVRSRKATPCPDDSTRLRKSIDDFRNHMLNMSEVVDENSIANLSSRYDAIIVGSDQVWSALYGKQMIYFLDWLPAESKPLRIAYAACSAHSFVRGTQKYRLSAMLATFDAIGVRDTTTQAMVSSTCPQASPRLVADPTLLHDFDEFAADNTVDGKPYILTYILGTEIRGGHHAALELMRRRIGADTPIRAIVPAESVSGIEKYADEIITYTSPEQWVSLIRNAAMLYTDSFHGIMFALKYDVPFFAYYANAIRASRLVDLKNRFPQLPVFDSVPRALPPTIVPELKQWIEESKAFIQNALATKR